MGQRTSQDLHYSAVAELAEHGAGAVGPLRLELLERPGCGAVFAPPCLSAEGFAHPRQPRRPGLPITEPGVLGPQAVGIIELRGEDGCHPEAEHIPQTVLGQTVQQVDDGKIGVRPRLMEPFLTHRPTAVVGDIGQMGVQDEAQRAQILDDWCG